MHKFKNDNVRTKKDELKIPNYYGDGAKWHSYFFFFFFFFVNLATFGEGTQLKLSCHTFFNMFLFQNMVTFSLHKSNMDFMIIFQPYFTKISFLKHNYFFILETRFN